jgi:hypothetical protein
VFGEFYLGAIGMTGQAVITIVDIAGDAHVHIVHISLVVAGETREYGFVTGVSVAR